jgi:hypothetical protein
MPESFNLIVERLKRLPPVPGEVWQGGWVRLPAWIRDDEMGGEPFRPTAAFWISVPRRQLHMSEPLPPVEATPDVLLRTAAEFAEGKIIGGHRPEALEVKDAALAEELSRTLGSAGIAVWVREQLAALDGAMADLSHSMNAKTPPGPLTAEGMTPDRLRGFAVAAAAFYRASPWRHLTDEDLIQIEAPKPPKGMAFVTVLGGGGKSFGLGFFAKRADHIALRDEGDPTAIFRSGSAWSLQFDAIDHIPFLDADTWEGGALPLAAPDAYPTLFQYRPTGGVGRADAKTTAFAEGLLRALAATTETEMDAGRWEKAVETAGGPVTYKLSLPDLLEAQRPAKTQSGGSVAELPVDPRAMMERMMTQIGRLLEQRGIDSIEEANSFLEENVTGRDPAKLLGPESDREMTPLQRAQDLVYQARESRGRRELQLAREALAICPDCADAYVVLAERASDPLKSAELYAQGVAAGERALKQEYGEEFFEEEAGNFWGILETRPYMRARQGLAMRLNDAGRADEAIGHYRELLRFNPGDNQRRPRSAAPGAAARQPIR